MKKALTLVLCSSLLWSCSGESKTGYVRLPSLYESFPLKKKYEAELMHIQNTRKAILDSLYMEAMRRPELQQAYLEKKQYFEDDIAKVSSQYDQAIWKQINQYVTDYGEAEGYDYIFGADGTGTLMYAGKSHEITNEVTQYISQRYAGEKK